MRNPLPFIELKFRTLLHFWDATEIPNNVNIEAHGYPFSGLLSMPFLLEFALFAPFGLAGLLLSLGRKTSGRQRMVASFVIMFMAATVAFYMLARFRIAIIPLLCVLAAGTVTRLAQMKRLTSKQRTAAILSLVAAAIIVNGALFLYRYGYESSVIAAISPEGTCIQSPNGTVLIHDHGPLPMGVGGISAPVNVSPSEPLTIQKRFVLPEDRKGLGKFFQVRMLTLDPTKADKMGYNKIIVTHGYQKRTVYLKTFYAFSHFICADFDQLQIDPDGRTVTFTFQFAPDLASCATADVLRDFGRTTFEGAIPPFNSPCEAFAELEFTTYSPICALSAEPK